MVDLPIAYDLGPVTRALSKKKTNKAALAASSALRLLRDGRSALHDLLYANELLDFLVGDNPLATGEEFKLPTSARGAFLSIAILHYVRATQPPSQSGSGEVRKHLKVRKDLSQPQQDLHDRLVVLRNKGIAHLDYERPIGDKSYADEVLVVVHDNKGKHRFDLADRRLVFQVKFEKEVRLLVKDAIKFAWNIVLERYEDAGHHLRDISRNDPEVGRLIQRFPFDAVAFYGNEGMAHDFLTNGFTVSPKSDEMVIFEGWPDPPNAE